MKAKAVCVMRTDLRNTDGNKVPKGKLIAQGGHAFVGLLTKLMVSPPGIITTADTSIRCLYLKHFEPLQLWLDGKFTKIVLAVDSEEELLDLYSKAKSFGLNCVLITDSGDTEFSEPTNTCIGIGPSWDINIDKITGHLKGYS
jgi:PTH2 family peptidyl-tRNA hydrolase